MHHLGLNIWSELDVEGEQVRAIGPIQQARTQTAIHTPEQTRMRAYASAFRCASNTAVGEGRRMLPKRFIDEDCVPLPRKDALGHYMFTAGLHHIGDQHFWCQQCGAHTCMRARKLTKPCTGKNANPTATDRLKNGTDPYTARQLSMRPRRLTVEDVGYVGKEEGTWSCASETGIERPPHAAANMVVQPQTGSVSSDDDPFGFGFGLDEF